MRAVILGLEVSGALASGAESLYLGRRLAAATVREAGTCRKTSSGGTLRAKVVNFCPDSLEPVQAEEDYLLNSSGTAAGTSYMTEDL